MMLYPDKQGLGNTAIGPNFQMSFLKSIGPMNTFLFQYGNRQIHNSCKRLMQFSRLDDEIKKMMIDNYRCT